MFIKNIIFRLGAFFALPVVLSERNINFLKQRVETGPILLKNLQVMIKTGPILLKNLEVRVETGPIY